MRDRVHKGAIVLNYVPIDLQVVDILTKPFAKGKFKILREANTGKFEILREANTGGAHLP